MGILGSWEVMTLNIENGASFLMLSLFGVPTGLRTTAEDPPQGQGRGGRLISQSRQDWGIHLEAKVLGARQTEAKLDAATQARVQHNSR